MYLYFLNPFLLFHLHLPSNWPENYSSAFIDMGRCDVSLMPPEKSTCRYGSLGCLADASRTFGPPKKDRNKRRRRRDSNRRPLGPSSCRDDALDRSTTTAHSASFLCLSLYVILMMVPCSLCFLCVTFGLNLMLETK